MAGPSSLKILGLPLVAVGYSTLYAGTSDALLLAVLSIARQGHILALLADYFGPFLPQVGIRTVVGTFIGLFTLRFLRLNWTKVDPPAWDGPGKALLFPCKTTHSRMFPEKHSFSYSYLVVGIPVGWEGNAAGMVSVGAKGKPGRGWFNIDAADYLDRGNGEIGLRAKLDDYLRKQGADPAAYPFAYLVTAARFLGYHFNPVSFWYLYDAEKYLAAMILEVNNTFDERRMYFLTPDGKTIEQAKNPQQNAAPRATLKQSWPKDFHVSPFNSRKGSYTLTASDPLSPFMQGTGPITNSITLASSKGHGKLVARLIPDGDAIDPLTISAYYKFWFLASWWWVGLVTFPRIVYEAGLLFFRRNLHVWFRPEPLKDTIGRNADSTEGQLELIFRRYLRYLVEQSAAPLAVKYVPGGIPGNAGELILSPTARDGTEAVEELEFKVLTPVFYSRFVYYAHDLEALFCELNESCTIWVSRPDLLPKFALKKPSPPLASSNLVDFACFKLIQYLRVRPERITRPLTSSVVTSEKPQAVDIRNFRISSMDGFVLAHETASARATYRRSVLKLILADKFALGLMPLLEMQRFILQAWFAWSLAATIGVLLSDLLSGFQRG
ncbi:hypothetical protein B0T17DRAFT_481508 [Bombardia bombarda]|uniref:DNA-binding WRKY domain-containing protein n=1 Tax=Bombardia bombarda TaxID=252184 RepID=A0AA40CEQ9_9PEZI|nr:hypothetical protein B0T17DRAFT_481508 [Bombardia bombarda]